MIVIAVAAACGGSSWQPGESCGRVNNECTAHADCCSYACIAGQCACAPAGEHCLTSLGCCVGNQCIDEQCVAGCRSLGTQCSRDTECCTGSCVSFQCSNVSSIIDSPAAIDSCPSCCVTNGQVCSTQTDCCDGLFCDSSLHCSPCGTGGATCTFDSCCDPRACLGSGGCCRLPGESSASLSGCCSGASFMLGKCCANALRSCTGPNECCTGICTNNLCQSAPDGGTCSGTFDCAGTFSMCVNNTCCAPQGESCSLDTGCCSGNCKPNNTCN